MKLLSYHIENYGKLHDVDGVFNDTITCVCENNGFGKSTLASFIKAMFYGLATYTAKTKNFEDRQHFYPFSGGKFGGNITFEKDGKTYKIERFFDKKGNKNDELRVYCNGSLCEDLGEEIGRTLFGLDEESFQKTVFITADEIEIASTHVINERLNRSGDLGGEADFEEAIDALEKAKKNLKAARGNNDKISMKSARIHELTTQIENLKDMGSSLETEYTERERLAKSLTALEKEESVANAQAVIAEKWARLDGMTAQVESHEKTLSALKEKYPNGIPVKEDRLILRECLRKSGIISGELKTAEFDETKQASLRALEEKFSGGMPSEETFSQYQEKLNRITALKAEVKTFTTQEETDKEKSLKEKFSVKCPTEEELSQVREAVDAYQKKDTELKALTASLLSGDTASGTTEKWRMPTLIGGLSCLALGVGLTFAVLAIGIVFIALGMGAAILSLVGNKGYQAVFSSEISIVAAKIQGEMKEAEGKILAFTVPYGYYSEMGATQTFAVLDEDVKAFHAAIKTEREKEELVTAKTQELATLTEEMKTVLCGYGEVEDLQSGLNRLQADAKKYHSLQSDYNAATEKKTRVLQDKEENEKALSAVLEKYLLEENVATMDGLTALEVDAERYEKSEKEHNRLQVELLGYKEKNGLVERPDSEGKDLSALRAQLTQLRGELAGCDKRIAEIERYMEKLPDLESELEREKETLVYYKERHELLADTIDVLKGAEQNLKDKYIAPIKDRFSLYAQSIEKVLNEKVTMDKDFRIMFERNGENRDERHLSAGERAICALCLRLALIDNMYEAEQPFIVMDDPFVHLDKGHLESTASVVKELSKDRQIIYFCCHESREIK